MVCQKCLDFCHTQKNYKRDVTICSRCNQLDHMSRDCNSDTTECHHCVEDHPTILNKCSLYRYEKEISRIQIKLKVSRQQAKIIFDMQNPNFMMNFARTARASTGIHKEPQDPGQSTNEVATPEMDISLINKRQREHEYENNMRQIGEEQTSTATSGCSVNSKRKKKNKDIDHSDAGAAVDAVVQSHVNHLPQ